MSDNGGYVWTVPVSGWYCVGPGPTRKFTGGELVVMDQALPAGYPDGPVASGFWLQRQIPDRPDQPEERVWLVRGSKLVRPEARDPEKTLEEIIGDAFAPALRELADACSEILGQESGPEDSPEQVSSGEDGQGGVLCGCPCGCSRRSHWRDLLNRQCPECRRKCPVTCQEPCSA